MSCINKELVSTVGGISIRNPYLFPIQIAGILSGFIGAVLVKRKPNVSWFWAFLFFTAMNFTSLFAHNLSEKYSFLWKIARLADISCTGSSSLSLMLVPFQLQSSVVPIITSMLLTILAISSAPFTAEFVYVGCMILATVALAPNLFTLSMSKMGPLISLTGLAIILIALPVDGLLCKADSMFSGVELVFLGCDFCFIGFIFMALNPTAVKVKKQ